VWLVCTVALAFLSEAFEFIWGPNHEAAAVPAIASAPAHAASMAAPTEMDVNMAEGNEASTDADESPAPSLVSALEPTLRISDASTARAPLFGASVNALARTW
jgi:hypothetical protein